MRGKSIARGLWARALVLLVAVLGIAIVGAPSAAEGASAVKPFSVMAGSATVRRADLADVMPEWLADGALTAVCGEDVEFLMALPVRPDGTVAMNRLDVVVSTQVGVIDWQDPGRLPLDLDSVRIAYAEGSIASEADLFAFAKEAGWEGLSLADYGLASSGNGSQATYRFDEVKAPEGASWALVRGTISVPAFSFRKNVATGSFNPVVPVISVLPRFDGSLPSGLAVANVPISCGGWVLTDIEGADSVDVGAAATFDFTFHWTGKGDPGNFVAMTRELGQKGDSILQPGQGEGETWYCRQGDTGEFEHSLSVEVARVLPGDHGVCYTPVEGVFLGDYKWIRVPVTVKLSESAVPAIGGLTVGCGLVEVPGEAEATECATRWDLLSSLWETIVSIVRPVDSTGTLSVAVDSPGDVGERGNAQEGKHYAQPGDEVAFDIALADVQGTTLAAGDPVDIHVVDEALGIDEVVGEGVPLAAGDSLGLSASWTWDVTADVLSKQGPDGCSFTFRVTDPEAAGRVVAEVKAPSVDVVLPRLSISAAADRLTVERGGEAQVRILVTNAQPGSVARGVSVSETLFALALSGEPAAAVGGEAVAVSAISDEDGVTLKCAEAELVGNSTLEISHGLAVDEGAEAGSTSVVDVVASTSTEGVEAASASFAISVPEEVVPDDDPTTTDRLLAYATDGEGPLPLDGMTQPGEGVTFTGELSFTKASVPSSFEVTGVAPDGCVLDAITTWGGETQTFTDGDAFRVVFASASDLDFTITVYCTVESGAVGGTSLSLPMTLAANGVSTQIPQVAAEAASGSALPALTVVVPSPKMDVEASVASATGEAHETLWASPTDTVRLAYSMSEATVGAYTKNLVATCVVPEWLEDVTVTADGAVSGFVDYDPVTRVASWTTTDLAYSTSAAAGMVITGTVSPSIPEGVIDVASALTVDGVAAPVSLTSIEGVRPRVAISVTDGGTYVASAGDEIAYDVTVENVVAGTVASDVAVDLALPEGLSLADDGEGIALASADASISLGSVRYGEPQTRKVRARVADGFTGQVEPVFTASVGGVQVASATEHSYVVGEGLDVGLWVDEAWLSSFDSTRAHLLVSWDDEAGDGADDVTAKVTLPEGLSASADSVQVLAGGVEVVPSFDAGVLSLHFDHLDSGDPVHIAFDVSSADTFANDMAFSAEASFSGGSDTAATTVSVAHPTWTTSVAMAIPELVDRQMTDEDGAFQVAPGEEVSVLVTVTNDYGLGADSLAVRGLSSVLTVPDGFGVGSAQPSFAWTSNPEAHAADDVAVSWDEAAGAYLMSVAELGEGESITFSLPVRAAEDWLGGASGFVVRGSDASGAVSGEACAMAVPYAPVLAVAKTSDRETAAAGDRVNFTVDVFQATPRTRALGVTVTDELPEGLVLEGSPVCSHPSSVVTVAEDGRSFTVSADALSDGSPLTVTYATIVSSGASFPLENRATATAANADFSEAAIRPIDAFVEHGEHVWGEWEVEEAPTCTEEGWSSRRCEVCGVPEEARLNPAGHDVVEEDVTTKEPTCTEAGTLVHRSKCSRCGEVFAETETAIGALGHEFEGGVCVRCGLSEHPGEEHEHTWGEWQTVTEPTCTEDGLSRRFCSGCAESEERQEPALGHDFADGVCTRCGALEGAPSPASAVFEPASAKVGDDVTLNVRWPVAAEEGVQTLSVELGDGLSLAGDVTWLGDADVEWLVDGDHLVITCASSLDQTLELSIPLTVGRGAELPVTVAVTSAGGTVHATLSAASGAFGDAGDPGDSGGPNSSVSGDPNSSVSGDGSQVVYGFDYSTMQPVQSKMPDTGVLAWGAVALAGAIVAAVALLGHVVRGRRA